MKKLLKILLLVIACTTLCAACNEIGNNDIIVTYPEDVNVSNFSLKETAWNWNWQNTKADTLYTVNSAEELLTYISCQKKDAPAIDFDKHSLLLVRGGTTLLKMSS